MRLNEIVAQHPNSYVVLHPIKRDSITSFVKDWQVLNVASNLEDAVKWRADKESGYPANSLCIYNTAEPDDGSEASIVAQFFRVYFNQEVT